MAQPKEVYIEVVKPCWINGTAHGIGSIVKVKESDGLMAIGSKKAIASKASAEKVVPFGSKKAAPAPKAEGK